MTIIHFVRHGEKQLGIEDPKLTKIGIKQAKQAGQYFSQFPINKIISSPSKRTVETAQYISQTLNLSYQTNSLLIERMNWNPKLSPRDIFINEWILSTHNRDYKPKWGSSSRATGKRIAQLITNFDLKKRQHIILVTHGGAIADYLRNCFEDKFLIPLQKKYPKGTGYRLFNCSITSLEYQNKPQIKLVNYTGHLNNISE